MQSSESGLETKMKDNVKGKGGGRKTKTDEKVSHGRKGNEWDESCCTITFCNNWN